VTEFYGIASTLAPQLFQLLPVPGASRCLDPSHLLFGHLRKWGCPFIHLPRGAAKLDDDVVIVVVVIEVEGIQVTGPQIIVGYISYI
jgi:hypothetical protein